MKRMPSVMKPQHSFSKVPKADIPRSQFDRSHGLKTAFDVDYLIPIFVDEVLPADTFKLNMSAFARLSTPIYPIMDNLFLDTFFFFVPNRLLWDNWEKFCGYQENPFDTTDYLVPVMPSPSSTGYDEQSLSDYLGLPTKVPDYEHISLYHRAYNLIYNEWFRDQNLIDSVVVDTDDGPDDPADYILLKRGKRHDYFTSCLPWPQKGDSVSLPLTGPAPVFGDGNALGIWDGTTRYGLLEDSGGDLSALTGAYSEDVGTSGVNTGTAPTDFEALGIVQSGVSGLYANLTNVTAATINELRQSFQIQKLLERDARGGTRYFEILQSHYGVTSPDSRLQRPEYLGGGSSRININPIAQTSATDAQPSPLGTLSAFGTTSATGHGFNKSFVEHGIILGLANVRGDLNYQQGLNRAFSRTDRWSYFWPALSHIGEQAVLNKEIYLQNTSADEDVFGYQERYAEYRYKPSQITGVFRSNATASLDAWHIAQDFAALPVLNQSFIEQAMPIDRVLSVTDEPDLLFDAFFDLKCTRPMPMYGVPGLIDHF